MNHAYTNVANQKNIIILLVKTLDQSIISTIILIFIIIYIASGNKIEDIKADTGVAAFQ